MVVVFMKKKETELDLGDEFGPRLSQMSSKELEGRHLRKLFFSAALSESGMQSLQGKGI